MAEMSPGAALRQLRQAHAGLKRARQLMRQAREDSRLAPKVLAAGWDSLRAAHKLMAEIPLGAADDAVMTQQLAVQRYATSLLVRLRRLVRHEGLEEDDGEMPDPDDEDIA
jgi:hypothetical protein